MLNPNRNNINGAQGNTAKYRRNMYKRIRKELSSNIALVLPIRQDPKWHYLLHRDTNDT